MRTTEINKCFENMSIWRVGSWVDFGLSGEAIMSLNCRIVNIGKLEFATVILLGSTKGPISLEKLQAYLEEGEWRINHVHLVDNYKALCDQVAVQFFDGIEGVEVRQFLTSDDDVRLLLVKGHVAVILEPYDD